ncbi:MAG: (2Fe-2S)-binding protein [Armatimonadetes bacterium 13_1_40CM_3_65_7]|nr:MAG: (2Fe-2S)-binding protein [Armatimonadetes bacterium 13_1_40CM_3_65_7]
MSCSGPGRGDRVKLTVNGDEREVEAADHESLLTVLRERLGLPGSKNACEQGECACLVLGAAAAGREVRTVESLSEGDRLHPVQRAFVDMGAVQCGFCTPGLIVSTYALLNENPEPSDQEVREALSGNICRCTGYGKILEAVQRASAGMYGR